MCQTHDPLPTPRDRERDRRRRLRERERECRHRPRDSDCDRRLDEFLRRDTTSPNAGSAAPKGGGALPKLPIGKGIKARANAAACENLLTKLTQYKHRMLNDLVTNR